MQRDIIFAFSDEDTGLPDNKTMCVTKAHSSDRKLGKVRETQRYGEWSLMLQDEKYWYQGGK